MQIITTHSNVDFDALAAVAAAALIYPDAVPVLPKRMNPNVKAFLAIHKDLFNIHAPEEIDPDAVTRLVVVDTHQWSRLESGLRGLSEKGDLDITVWDHHTGQTEGRIEATRFFQREVGAAVTLLVDRIKAERKPMSPIQTTLFLAGIYEDTGNLTFPTTRPEDAYAAAFLLEQQADLKIVGSFLRPAYGEKQKDILFQMLQSAQRTKLNEYTVSFNKLQMEGHLDGLAMIVKMYRELVNVDAAFGIFWTPDRKRCIVIGRGADSRLDIGAIMRILGGGGHPGAGSALLKSVNPQAVVEIISELIAGNQQASVQISDLMSFPVHSVEASTPMKAVAETLQSAGFSGLPVVEGTRLVGMISKRDFKKLKQRKQMKMPVKAFMRTDVIVIDPAQSPRQATRLMVKHDIGRLPVIEDGQMIGILSRSDVMRYFYDLLPE